MKAKLIVFPIRGRNWCFSRSIDHTLSASSSTTSSQSPSSLKQLWKTINTGDKPINAKAELLTDYVEKAYDVAKEYKSKCIDFYYSTGINKQNRLEYYQDTTHQNEKGRRVLANILAEELF
jgi:lysophospholipase L1-like esterase